MASIWEQTADLERRPPLDEDLRVDVAVIGAGMTGVLTAFLLQQKGARCVVLEASHIGSGQTAGTTAKLTSQHGLIYAELIERFGREQAQEYADANQRAVARYRQLAAELGVACMLEEEDAFVYGLHDAEPLRCEAEAAASLGLPASFVETVPLPFPVAGAVRFSGQAQFHPLRFLAGLCRDLTVYEQTRVTEADGHSLRANGHTVTAGQVVFATHYPFVNLPGLYFARLHQSRAYTLALENAAHAGGMYIGAEERDLSVRAAGQLLLLCGEDHRTGENAAGGRYDALRRIAAVLYPGSREVARWSAQDCMTPDGVPYIGRYAESTPDWYVATGYNKWGMSSSMVAACRISDWIAGDAPYAPGIFDPRRFNADTAVEVLQTGGQALKGLGLQYLTVPETQVGELPEGHGGVVSTETEEKVGVYREPGGCLHAVGTRCPHMGCQVAWNPDEKSWECPCHGSRFDLDGHVIDNPAQEDLPQARVTPCADGKPDETAPDVE